MLPLLDEKRVQGHGLAETPMNSPLLRRVLVAFGRLSLVLILSHAFRGEPVRAQAPDLLWINYDVMDYLSSSGVFAVDEFTNVYANSQGNVVKINANGSTVQATAYCPLPGFAQRDSAGNFYFAGTLKCLEGLQTQDFGGIVLSNYPVFVVKYSPAGALQWATNFGAPGWCGSFVDDFKLDGIGNAYVAYGFSLGAGRYRAVAKVDPNGGLAWSPLIVSNVPANFLVRLTPQSPTNLYTLVYRDSPSTAWL
jgi:hypothetical protein